ncbi:Non-homologous end joining protein Ku [Streptomyces spiroverticillatus]
MPRPVWSGAVSFGLVTIPIKVYPATESHNISFHQYHLEDMGRVRYQKVCEDTRRVWWARPAGVGHGGLWSWYGCRRSWPRWGRAGVRA